MISRQISAQSNIHPLNIQPKRLRPRRPHPTAPAQIHLAHSAERYQSAITRIAQEAIAGDDVDRAISALANSLRIAPTIVHHEIDQYIDLLTG